MHHVPHDGPPRLRGHGALIGAVDTTIRVEKVGKSRSATIDKANDGGEGISIGFDLVSVELSVDEDGVATTAPVVDPLDGPASKSASSRKLSDRQRLALETLQDLCLDGKSLPASFGLPSDIRAVSTGRWRDELFTRGVLDPQAKNPRQDFIRLKGALQARHLAAEREDLVWNVARQTVAGGRSA